MSPESRNSSSGSTEKPWYQTYWGAIAAVAVLLLLILAYVIVHNEVISEGNQKQQALIAGYKGTEVVLSDCEVKTRSAVGVTTAESGALNEFVDGAVEGRYTVGSSVQPGSGSFFSAIREAYPDTAGLSKAYETVQITINGCRTRFANKQEELQKQLALFESWRTGSWKVRTFGGGNYPNDELEIKAGDEILTGKDAIRQMREVVATGETKEERATNEIQNENPFEASAGEKSAE